MYLIRWFDGDRHYECAANDNRSAWQIYWVIKGEMDRINLHRIEEIDKILGWITIQGSGGYHDPRSGSRLDLVKSGCDPHICLPLSE